MPLTLQVKFTQVFCVMMKIGTLFAKNGTCWLLEIVTSNDAALVTCGVGSMQLSVVRPSVRPSVCPVDRRQLCRAVGLLLSALRAPRTSDRSISAGWGRRRSAADAGSVMLRADGGCSTRACRWIFSGEGGCVRVKCNVLQYQRCQPHVEIRQ